MEKCCLWINGKKVADVNGIRENFNISDLRGYFHGGRLADWLLAHGAEKEAELVRMIPKGENPDKMLQDIFCGKDEEKTPPAIIYHKQTEKPAAVNGNGSVAVGGSFNQSSFGGSYTAGIGSFGSYSYQYEYEFSKSSFSATSYTIGSYGFGSFSFGSYRFGSFPTSSFNMGGSFSYDEFVNQQKITDKELLRYFTSEPLNKYGYGIHLI